MQGMRMEKHEVYSVLITGEKGRRGTGTLFYRKPSEFFYVLTCAHVVYGAETVKINILVADKKDTIKNYEVTATKEQFYYSPIDIVTQINELGSTHTCDIAVIRCCASDIPLRSTNYVIYPMSVQERIVAVGYPESDNNLNIYYQQDQFCGQVLKILPDQNDFVIRITDDFLNLADREIDLKGFSGSAVWDEANIKEHKYLFGGIVSRGLKTDINRSRVCVVNARLVQSLLREEFGIHIDTKIPGIPEKDIAPGFTGETTENTEDLRIVRKSWIENERKKIQIYIDDLKLQNAIDTCKNTISNAEFNKCEEKQKFNIYHNLLEAYRLAREYDVYDKTVAEMHEAGIRGNGEHYSIAVRYFESFDYEKALEYADKALALNPAGNLELVLKQAIQVCMSGNPSISSLSQIIGSNDQLLIKPKSEFEEESIYLFLGYVFGSKFKETGRAVRCLNRSYQVGGNYIILETLALAYYFHSLNNAMKQEDVNAIDPFKIDQIELNKARDAFLLIITAADELYLKGMFGRIGLQIFKCFYYMNDGFRVLKHYNDLMKYCSFADKETLREVQINYVEFALRKGPVNLVDFTALSEYDRKYFELTMLMQKPLAQFDRSSLVPVAMTETELRMVVSQAEEQLHQLMLAECNSGWNLDSVNIMLINLYGNGASRYNWNVLQEIRKHSAKIKNQSVMELVKLYIDEIEVQDFQKSEKKYKDFFEQRRDIRSFNEWCRFYLRYGKIEKVKELYDSVFEDRHFLIEEQTEYFYREYILFTQRYRLDLTPAIRCFVKFGSDIKDVFIKNLFEMDLNFCTVTFNNPDYMLDIEQELLEVGIIAVTEYKFKCLVINMLNCRFAEAEKFTTPVLLTNIYSMNIFEKMFFAWKGYIALRNQYWDSMRRYSLDQLNDIYRNEKEFAHCRDVFEKYNLKIRKSIVVDLWAIYYLVRNNAIEILDIFNKVYVAHVVISAALTEILNVDDDCVRKALDYIEKKSNIVIQSPTLAERLIIKTKENNYKDIDNVLLLAELVDCPAIIGEFRFPIKDRFYGRVIRPDCFEELRQYVCG